MSRHKIPCRQPVPSALSTASVGSVLGRESVVQVAPRRNAFMRSGAGTPNTRQ
jgi:hypothetical protein